MKIYYNYLILFLVVYNISCISTRNSSYSELTGIYSGVSKGILNADNHYELELKYNQEFYFKIISFDGTSKCSGKWEIIDNNIILNCEASNDIPTLLSKGYMGERKFILQIKSSNKLKFNKAIFIKKQ